MFYYFNLLFTAFKLSVNYDWWIMYWMKSNKDYKKSVCVCVPNFLDMPFYPWTCSSLFPCICHCEEMSFVRSTETKWALSKCSRTKRSLLYSVIVKEWINTDEEKKNHLFPPPPPQKKNVLLISVIYKQIQLQWNRVIKRSHVTKPSYNKLMLLVPALYTSLFLVTLMKKKPVMTR